MERIERSACTSNQVELNQQLICYPTYSYPRIFITTVDSLVSNMRILYSESKIRSTDSGSNAVNYVIVELDKTVYECPSCDTRSNVTIPFEFKIECFHKELPETYRVKITSMTDQRLIGNFIVETGTRRIIQRPYDEDRQLLLYPTSMDAHHEQQKSAETTYNQIFENKKQGCCYTIRIDRGTSEDRYKCRNSSKVEIPSDIHPTDDNNMIRDRTNSCIAYGLPTFSEFEVVDFKPLEEKYYTTEWRVAIIPKKIQVALNE